MAQEIDLCAQWSTQWRKAKTRAQCTKRQSKAQLLVLILQQSSIRNQSAALARAPPKLPTARS